MMIRLRLRVVSCERGNWSYFWCVVVREHGLVLVDQSLGRLTRLYTILSLRCHLAVNIPEKGGSVDIM